MSKESKSLQTDKDTENPSAHDENQATYGDLRDDNRLVMRHSIALNIDNFRASSDAFEVRPEQTYPPMAAQQPPFASLIVPNRNGKRFIDTLFSSLQTQTFQDFEVLFVDDASTDDSISYLEEVYSTHIVGSPDIDSALFELRIIANRSNVGFVSCCNQGASIARGRILVMLNNDTEPEVNWLEELVKAVCANPTAAIVTSKVLLFDKRDHLHTTGDMLGRDGIPINRGVWQKDRGQFDAQPFVFSGSGCASAYRREAWNALGGFDEDFWMYLEDVDFAFRAQLAGWDAIFVPNARIYHQLSATSGDVLSSYQVGRNTIWTIVKNMPRSLLLKNLSVILLSQARIAIDALRNIRGAAARARLKGQLASLLGLPRQLQKRQVIQQRRILEDRFLEDRLNTIE